MATTTTSRQIEPPQLWPLARRLKAWRAARTPGQRIPEELWQAAAELAHLHGLSRTATALQLNYYDLQRRAAATACTPRKRCVMTPAFVELPTPSAVSPIGEGGTLEVVRASGTRLVLRLPNSSPRDLLPLVQLFLRQRL
jgi:hypothetical protein